MSDLVDPDLIERIVGVPRHVSTHYGRAVTSDRCVYVLHSHTCRATTPDLRTCPFSLALDNSSGAPDARWIPDRAMALRIEAGQLVPEGADLGADTPAR